MIRFKQRAGSLSPGPWWQSPTVVAAIISAVATIIAALIYVRS